MQPDSLKWLEDIRDSAEYILSATRNETLESFSQSRTLRQAVERNFEIIGEAINRIGKADPSLADMLSERKRIIAFRNILIHGYDQIDNAIVWDVIARYLPTLLGEVQSALTPPHD